MPLMTQPKFADAAAHFKKAVEYSRKHSALTQKALEKYGAHGSQISGVIRDHFPAKVKNELRALARDVTAHSDAAYAARPPRVQLATMRKLSKEIATKYGSGFYGPQSNPKGRTKVKGNPMARKKRRTAAQIAATKKLVAFNKKKRGKKKTTKKRATRKNPLSQPAKAAIRRQPKSRLNVVFAIKNGAVKYYDGLKGWVTSKGRAGRYDVAHARVVARHTGRFAGPGYSVGVTSESTTVAELRKLMQPGK